jgi:pimeloyl-ACP methyl ester carboxylesterase
MLATLSTIALIVGSVVAVVALLAILLLVITYRQARTLLTPVRKPLDLRPEDVGLTVEDLSIPGPRGQLAAWYLPAQNACTLICCHGINDNRAQWLRQVARLHANRGYGALIFDFAGHGESEGTQVTYGVRERADVAAVLAYLRGRGDVDMGGIGTMGYSLGAITSVLAAAEEPDLRAVVIESGFADFEQDVGAIFHRFTRLPAFPFANLIVFWGQRMAGVKLGDIRPASIIGRIAPRAVFIISDLNDSLANEPYDGEQLFAHAGEPKRLWQVPGVEHVQAFNALPEEWSARVEAFLDEFLAGPLRARESGAPRAGTDDA